MVSPNFRKCAFRDCIFKDKKAQGMVSIIGQPHVVCPRKYAKEYYHIDCYWEFLEFGKLTQELKDIRAEHPRLINAFETGEFKS